MTQPLNAEHGDEDVIHRYVAGTLAREDVATFERHLLTCASCQIAVRDGAAIRELLRSPGSAASVSGARSRRLRPLLWAIPLVAAALVMFVASRSDPVRRLGRVDRVPPFEPLAVRGAARDADRTVDSAMVVYRAGRFTEAAFLLREAMKTDSSPGVLFYGGVSALAAGDAAAAIGSLRRVASQPGNAYADDARFYLGKAWLRAGDADSAVAHLAAVSEGSRLYPNARALLDSVRSARTR